MRVLLADDDDDIRFVVEQLLRRRGWMLTAVTSAAEARGLLGEDEFDVLVLDENMPPGSGLDVAQEVRAAGDSTPIVLFTGFATTVDADRVEELGVRLLPKAEVIRLGAVVATLLGTDDTDG